MWTTLELSGPMNYISCWIQEGYGIVDLQMGWMENGEQQYTDWAFNNHQGEQFVLSTDEGAYLSLRPMDQSGYGII